MGGYTRISTAQQVPFENDSFRWRQPTRYAWRIRKRTIRKIIKTELLNTSFYRFLLLFVEAPLTCLNQQKTPQKGCLCFGGSGWIRTTSGVSQQIYSLPRLSNSGARPELFLSAYSGFALAKTDGAGSGTRTRISSLEGLRTSPCTTPAIIRKQGDYITHDKKIKRLFQSILSGLSAGNNHHRSAGNTQIPYFPYP